MNLIEIKRTASKLLEMLGSITDDLASQPKIEPEVPEYIVIKEDEKKITIKTMSTVKKSDGLQLEIPFSAQLFLKQAPNPLKNYTPHRPTKKSASSLYKKLIKYPEGSKIETFCTLLPPNDPSGRRVEYEYVNLSSKKAKPKIVIKTPDDKFTLKTISLVNASQKIGEQKLQDFLLKASELVMNGLPYRDLAIEYKISTYNNAHRHLIRAFRDVEIVPSKYTALKKAQDIFKSNKKKVSPPNDLIPVQNQLNWNQVDTKFYWKDVEDRVKSYNSRLDSKSQIVGAVGEVTAEIFFKKLGAHIISKLDEKSFRDFVLDGANIDIKSYSTKPYLNKKMVDERFDKARNTPFILVHVADTIGTVVGMVYPHDVKKCKVCDPNGRGDPAYEVSENIIKNIENTLGYFGIKHDQH